MRNQNAKRLLTDSLVNAEIYLDHSLDLRTKVTSAKKPRSEYYGIDQAVG